MERDSAGRFQSGRESRQARRSQISEGRARSSVGAGVAALISGAALGAAAMYLLDPNHGAQRRAMARNLAERALESSSEAARAASCAIGSALHAARDKVADTTSAAYDAMPNGKDIRDAGAQAVSSAGDTASSWLESATARRRKPSN